MSRRASRLQRCPWCLRTQTTPGAQSEVLSGLQPDRLGEASPCEQGVQPTILQGIWHGEAGHQAQPPLMFVHTARLNLKIANMQKLHVQCTGTETSILQGAFVSKCASHPH